jgi:formylglycine-generating enzyme required for sulfatase activity
MYFMKMYKIFVVLCLMPSIAFGQLCQKYRQEGITAFNNRDYALALKKFQGASKVSDAAQCADLSSWIDKTQKALQPKSVVTKPKDTPTKPKPEPSTPSVSTPFVAPQMVKVEGGTFQMGDNFDDIEAAKDEKPVHSVTLSDYYIGKYEVSQAEWKAIMGKNPSNFKGDNLPVESVSWDDIQIFIQKLNEKTGKNYRLPTEAEWEFAARERGKKVRFGNGKDIIDPSEINFDGSTSYKKSYSVAGVYRQKTVAVNSLTSNSLGLYHMSGNVWEWCSDWYDENYYKNSPSSNPKGAASGSNRVLRGGSWGDYAGLCRSANRDNYAPSGRGHILGFRLALSSL